MRTFSTRLAAVLASLVLAAPHPSAQSKANKPAPRDMSKTPVQSVWPLPPDQPRIQFVAAYSTSVDIEGAPQKSRMFALKEALLGKERMADQLPRTKRMMRPYGVAVDSRGRIIVTDTTQASVMVLDPTGKVFTQLSGQDLQVSLKTPVGVTVDAQDNIYVGDTGIGAIMQFGPDFAFVRMFGRAGEVSTPSGLAIDQTLNRLYAVDAQKHALVVLDLATGQVVKRVGAKGAKHGDFGYPSGVTVGPDGRVYVTDTMNYRVQVFDRDLKFVRAFGSLGDTPGKFRRPKGIAVDGDGIVYVVDSDFNNFQMFNGEGQPLLAVGEYGTRPGQMTLPAGVCIQRSTRKIYVADQANQRIQVFQRVGPAS
jgi:DNA-binding beta-propeller fold protein YncE